jgi:hypothetical protein
VTGSYGAGSKAAPSALTSDGRAVRRSPIRSPRAARSECVLPSKALGCVLQWPESVRQVHRCGLPDRRGNAPGAALKAVRTLSSERLGLLKSRVRRLRHGFSA